MKGQSQLIISVSLFVGNKVTSYFELVKPLVEFNFETIESRSNNMFELATQEEISKLTASNSGSSGGAKFTDEIDLDEDIDKTLHIKVNHHTKNLLIVKKNPGKPDSIKNHT